MSDAANSDLSVVLADGEFLIPSNREIGASRVPEALADQRCTYLCGNSLGPLSKRSQSLLQEELQVWATRAVEGHFSHPHGREWMNIADTVTPLFAELVGAQEKEVACMSTLTANLHLMMAAFYKPTPDRYKILCEAKAFPSDQYAFASQALLHGYDPGVAIVEMSPRVGEFTLRESDILDVIAKEGPSIALVIFSGVQYYTGQWFPMRTITSAAKEQGCICGWDLAHAIGNVPMALHDWNVDFAVWCSYKYLNSGPGGIGGLYIHEKWETSRPPQYAGWWGHDPTTRFAMPPAFTAIPGAQGYQQSNPSVLTTVSLLGSLQIFKEVGMMHPLRERSVRLTAELEKLLVQSRFYVPLNEVPARYPSVSSSINDTTGGAEVQQTSPPGFTIITPSNPDSRGAQLSLLFLPTGSDVMRCVFDRLSEVGVIADKREPNVIRLTPAPLYNTLEDCKRAASCLEGAFESLRPTK
ncbi:kynureninase [Leucogyrophana mollusca]|uniref:Kynureninase n=1 Tax=Leucogyrophana mollusca TaxID=85980 RepID=A0ACB8BCS0_9AGAM|nr:kynureninase [Leucogyrophana mollusca]